MWEEGIPVASSEPYADLGMLSPAVSALAECLASLSASLSGSGLSNGIAALVEFRADVVRPDPDTAHVLCLPDHGRPAYGPTAVEESVNCGPAIPQVIRVVIHGDFAARRRSSLVRIIDACIAFLRRLLALVMCALIRMTRVCAFSLLILAASRRYGRRSEPGDHVFPGNSSARKFQGSYLDA